MFKYFKILSFILFLVTISCEKEKSILNPESANGKVSIKTDKTIYVWQQSEGDKIIVIQGELQNNSTLTYYSKVGDSWGEKDLVLFSEKSAGKLEKYNSSDNKWNNSNLLGMLIEGSSIIEIEPSKKYSIHAHLSISNDKYKEETGKYRLRIDYFNFVNETTDTTTFSDYSNIFEIRSE